jgi:hypothetical protein
MTKKEGYKASIMKGYGFTENDINIISKENSAYLKIPPG